MCVSAYINSSCAVCCDIPGIPVCTSRWGRAQTLRTTEQFARIPVCGVFLVGTDPCGHAVLPSVQGLSISAGYSGGLTKCEGHEWCRTFHLELCEDPQAAKQAALTPLTPPKSLCECKASSLPCSHLSPQCPMSFIQSAWSKVLCL